jgi:hypothetical protein
MSKARSATIQNAVIVEVNNLCPKETPQFNTVFSGAQPRQLARIQRFGD